jgi:hypothetical protein
MLATTQATNATEIIKKANLSVSCHTLAQCLKEQGLVCRVWRKQLYISQKNQKARRDWALQHVSWMVDDWKKVIFSDESKFLLFKSDGCQYCWIKLGQALNPRYTLKNIKHGGGSLMVWGCITSQGVGRLHRIDGIMTGQSYIEILKEAYLGTLKDHKLKCSGKSTPIFQQDNDPKHCSKVAEAWFTKKRVCQLPWPPSSPDMNIIEHVWNQLDVLVHARNPLPHNKDEL